MKYIYLALCIFLFGISNSLYAQKYSYEIDLININRDKVVVKCNLPKIETENIDFIFPSVIPGSYAMKEFGRYIDDFKAFDKEGKPMDCIGVDKYNYTIYNARNLARVEYKVNDSWEETSNNKFIFQPGGTNIEPGKNVVMNHYGFFGYIDNMKNLPFEITVLKPAEWKGHTFLEIVKQEEQKDFLRTENYEALVDNPVIYCQPNESSFSIDSTTIKVCVYSEKDSITAESIAEQLKPLCNAMKEFLGVLPVQKYVFLFYFADAEKIKLHKGKGLGSGFGALEHNHCSFYFIPSTGNLEYAKRFILQVASHEFLHILTPLNVHSKEIDNFNFRFPVMSKHLWMYEGVTEYFSNIALVQNNLLSEREFIRDLRRKINHSESFGKLSMTEMSNNVTKSKFQKKYLSVYSRGAVLAMFLDLQILNSSDNKKTLKDVMLALSKEYGPSKPFDDDSLFSKIVQLTDNQLMNFFRDFVEGEEQPDYKLFLRLMGYGYEEFFQKEVYYFGQLGLSAGEEEGKYYFMQVGINKLGIRNKDQFISINDELVTEENLDDIFYNYFSENEEDKEVTVVVNRSGQEVKLSGKPYKVQMTKKHHIYPLKNIDDKMKAKKEKMFGLHSLKPVE